MHVVGAVISVMDGKCYYHHANRPYRGLIITVWHTL
jgi:hypothetical protein